MNFPKQFLISKYSLFIPDFHSEDLWDGYRIYYHKDFRFSRGKKRALLGIAWQTANGKQSPEELIGSAKDIISEEISWCGKYILIENDKVYTDMASLLDVFYSPYGISSSCALLAFAMGLPKKNYSSEGNLNWLPGPRTPYPEIRRLLASQIYNLGSGNVEKRLIIPSIPVFDTEETLVQAFCDSFSTSLHNMQSLFPQKKLLVALTGGHDSRTLLALMEYAGMEYECYTQEYEGIHPDDMLLAAELCKKLSRKHNIIPKCHGAFSSNAWNEYADFTSQLVQDADMEYYANGQFGVWTSDSLLLRSSVWESVIEYYYSFIPGYFDIGFFESEYNLPSNSFAAESLREYIAWCEISDQGEILSPPNRYLLEQRSGCWLAAIETGFCLLKDCTSIQPVNCRTFLAMLLQFPKNERYRKEHQEKIISYACPQIQKVPYCGKIDYRKAPVHVFFARCIRALKKLRKLGFRRGWEYYLHKR